MIFLENRIPQTFGVRFFFVFKFEFSVWKSTPSVFDHIVHQQNLQVIVQSFFKKKMNFSHENDGDKSAKFLEKRGQYLHTELNRFRQCVSHVETGLSMVR